ncbi:hypothetical protein EV426DRAFT_702081 [Tirmania nivea]|nr:hypothetical protein EV426DRAFT_702081 [Tirmania nivea]
MSGRNMIYMSPFSLLHVKEGLKYSLSIAFSTLGTIKSPSDQARLGVCNCTMGLRICEPCETPLRMSNNESPEAWPAVEPLVEPWNLVEGAKNGNSCDCVLAEDGEFWDCQNRCGDRNCLCHNENSIRIARAHLVRSYAEYPLPPELELASLEQDFEFLNHGYTYFIHHAETVELKRRLTYDAWCYYRREGGLLAERLQLLRGWVQDLPDDNSPAMVAGLVAFWKDAKALDRKVFFLDWSAAGLEHPLPWLRDLVAPVREDIEKALLGIEAQEGPES